MTALSFFFLCLAFLAMLLRVARPTRVLVDPEPHRPVCARTTQRVRRDPATGVVTVTVVRPAPRMFVFADPTQVVTAHTRMRVWHDSEGNTVVDFLGGDPEKVEGREVFFD